MHRVLTGRSNQLSCDVRKAMAATSRVLVQDYITQGGVRVPDNERTLKQAQHLCCLTTASDGFANTVLLGKAAGLGFVKVWDLGEIGAVESAPGNFEK
ncbi:hypothetical protein D9756_001095 [Leucocoprinus leucothites]|uniref:Uncharacterized protein n=1 Tax=Leucocoprinus leucothites TaxID=201217 RepID=A0A8H5GE82_9AGAR|nr:hypothetical protein D9756_001095 [Leucoagaricus leucothites]